MRIRRFVPAAVVCLVALASAALAADWPHYRGPNWDGKTPEDIRTDWPSGGPKVLWKAPLGDGSFGTFAVVGDGAYVFTSRGNEEGVLCLDVNTGKERWYAPVGQTTDDRMGGPGPRSTPTVVGDKVYALGTYFNLVCLNVADGKQVWAHDLAKESEAQNETQSIKEWGNAGSPIVEGDLVIVAGGGQGQTFLAFDKDDGKPAWKTGKEKVTHSTGTPATIGGVRQVVFLVQSGLLSIEPKTGKELWRAKFDYNVSTASAPVVGGENNDTVYCAAAYGVGSMAVKVTKAGDAFKAQQLWRQRGAPNGNHWMTPIYYEGHLYGLFGHRGKDKAKLECRELATGKVKWSEDAPGSGGAVTMAGKHLIVQHENGKIVIVEPTPTAYKQVAEAQPLKGKAWSMAVVSNGRMFARTDKEGVCLDVAGERSADVR